MRHRPNGMIGVRRSGWDVLRSGAGCRLVRSRSRGGDAARSRTANCRGYRNEATGVAELGRTNAAATKAPAWWSPARTGPPRSRPGGTVAVAGDATWMLLEDQSTATERLAGVDPANGHLLTFTQMKDIGGAGMQPIADDLWYVAPKGYTVIVRP